MIRFRGYTLRVVVRKMGNLARLTKVAVWKMDLPGWKMGVVVWLGENLRMSLMFRLGTSQVRVDTFVFCSDTLVLRQETF